MKALKAMLMATTALLAVSSCAQLGLREGKMLNINVIVTDPAGKPIPKALVMNGKEGYKAVHKFTGEDGIARFLRVGQVEFNPSILKNGFYAHRGTFVGDVRLPGVEREYRVVLKPVLDPVPIDTAELRRRFYPLEWEEKGGFDLEKLDFVAPYGGGVVTDIVFKTTWERIESKEIYRSGLAATTTLSVEGKDDALFPFEAPEVGTITKPGSLLMPPNVFPSNGWVRSIHQKAHFYDNGGWDPPVNMDTHLAFRVRTRLDEKGKVESAHVGWLQAPIRLGVITAIGPDKKQYFGPRTEFTPEWGLLDFTRHWNPNPKSLSLEPGGKRWENSLPDYIKTYKLENLPGIETLQRLPRDHPDFRPTPEEENERIRQEHAERRKEWERKRAEEQMVAPAP